MEEQKVLDDVSDVSLKTKSKKQIGDALTKIACAQLAVSNKYKQPLLEKWKRYEDLKAGNVKKKLRMQFNVALPIFSGLLDTLASDFDEPVELEYKKRHPSDYFKAQKVQAAWNIEKNKTDRDSRWDYKARIDKSLCILHGRGILKYYAESDPKYRSVLKNTDPLYFHSQPAGGGILENHLFSGEEDILRSESDLKIGSVDGFYDKKQIDELLLKANNKDYINTVTEHHVQKMQRYAALGLDPESNNYIGERIFNLVEWVLEHEGNRWYVLFDPWTSTWIRCEKLKDIYSKDLYPWTSWATHEDDKVFWSMSYADIIYPVADSIITLYNQELTNREKRNMGARAYDKDIFPDVAKLDAAQYRADALVPVDTKGGSRKIAEGIYHFETPELQGTIDLIGWTDGMLEKKTGINDISQGASLNAQKKVNIAFMEQASIAKRIGYKSQSYTECWGEIGTRFIQGLKDHMTEDMQIEILGDMGIEPDVLSREDLEFKADLGVSVVSSTARKQESGKKKQGRIEGYKLLAQSQNVNSEWRDAGIMRDIMDLNEDEIKLALDTKNYASRESTAKAHIAIQELIGGIEPEQNYAADAVFLKIITDYMMEHRNKLGMDRFKQFALYVAKHAESAMQNGQRKGTERGMRTAQMQMQAGNIPQAPANQKIPAPGPAPEIAQR